MQQTRGPENSEGENSNKQQGLNFERYKIKRARNDIFSRKKMEGESFPYFFYKRFFFKFQE